MSDNQNIKNKYSLLKMKAFMASSQFTIMKLRVMYRSQSWLQFQNECLLYSDITNIGSHNWQSLLVGGGMTLRLLAKFLLHKHLYRKFFSSRSGMMGLLMMSMLSRRNKVFTPTSMGNIRAHDNFISSIAFDPTGCFMATGSWDKTAKVWRVSPDGVAMTCVATLEGHRDYVRSVAFDPTGCFVATGSVDNTAKVWRMSPDGTAATCVATLAGHSEPLRCVAFHQTERFLATCSWDRTTKVWMIGSDGSKTACLANLKNSADVYTVAFHPTSDLLVIGDRNRSFEHYLMLWRLI